MKHSLFACATHQGIDRDTAVCIDSCRMPLVSVPGITGLGLARNVTLDAALDKALADGRDTIVMVDDDMIFSADDVQRLVDLSREFGAPTSAVYVTAGHKIAAMPLRPADRWDEARWLVGLGLVAIPTTLVQALKDESLRGVQGITVYTWEGPCEKHSWLGEDYRLFDRLGGAILAPVSVGHRKKHVFKAHADTISLLERTGGFDIAKD